MYNYNPAAGNSPPMPDILGQYYGHGPSMDHLLTSSTGLLYDPITSTYGRPVSPVHHQFGRRRRYSIGGLPTASAYNDYYDHSATHIDNLLNETCKSISRSSQILNQRLGLGRNISSYPAINVGCELHNHPSSTSPPYYNNENLMQLSSSFSSQPNMYFPPYDKSACISGNLYYPGTSAVAAATAVASGARVRPAFSSSHLNYSRPSMYNISSNNYNNASNLPYSTYNNNPNTQQQSQTTTTPYSNMLLQQRNLMPPSLHYSNPDYYHDHNNYYNQSYSSSHPHHNHLLHHHHNHHVQQQLQPQQPHYHPPHSHYVQHLNQSHIYGNYHNNAPPHFITGTHRQSMPSTSAQHQPQRHSQYQHLLHDQYPTSSSSQQYHLQQQIQQQLQSHHTATGLLGATSVGGGAAGAAASCGGGGGQATTSGGAMSGVSGGGVGIPHNTFVDHHVHLNNPLLSKIDNYVDYVGSSGKSNHNQSSAQSQQPQLPQPPPETKRQVSFKFDVDTLSID